jgi:ribosomal protein S12 methylthiotransferase accessory factor
MDIDGCALVVAVSESADLPGMSAVRRACAASGVDWLSVSIESDRAYVGPVSGHGRPGCDICARRRRQAARKRAHQHETVRRHQPELDRTRSPLLSGFAVDLVAALTGATVAGAARAGACPPATFVAIDLAELAVSRHRFLPDPGCPECGGLPPDSPDGARILLRSWPKSDPHTFRVRDLSSDGLDLMATYVDGAAGLIREVRTEPSRTFVRAVAPLSSRTSNESQHGWGRTLNARTARLTAVLESLERFAGVEPRGKRTTVHGSYRDLAPRAIDPRRLGLYPDDWYDRPDFPFARFHDGLELSWVWGFSFENREPVLVPERHAYYSLPQSAGPRLSYEISNGCALGGSLEEAILHGLLEVAERDAFLMTWYGRMPVPRLDLRTARDRTVPLMAESLSRQTGYDIAVFSTTLEQGIPCFWAMGIDRIGDPTRARAMCVGGAALRAENGIVNLLHELAHGLDHAGFATPDERERAARMVADPARVTAMGDHAMVYFHDAAFDRFDFLLSGSEPGGFDDLADTWHWPELTDLRDDLRELMARYLDRGLDIIVVDQTAPEHRTGGLSCVKVIVPGALPMTFGHENRRIHGLPRLYTVPAELGFRDRILTPADINPHPHPFP